MSLAYVALGSNLEQPADQIRAALAALAALDGSQLLSHSSLYLTTPVGYLDQPDFINAVALLDTTLTPYQLLDALMQIEAGFGRERSFRNAPRVLDLDVLLYQDTVLDDPQLLLPHPRMHQRAFVMVPLAEIAPGQQVGEHGLAADIAAALDCAGVVRLESSAQPRRQA
ncbi:2-amino-4-hydroxy-6-hydroxymethyldihydropteridine diphosphokinase [Aquitalea aquatica]|uniref:2-amino-4-hydroxy-6-hydroxymethyldihydropteridine pyrophosphokinase n=1 Tax=Aquitalea aquatica TaxID=3044273 RepID=A0A838Y7I6_9NEIS|nr:2-amino-4-hydroxy-6-hydroxymethyldihydropteridine diphosphokinase [Aquitalea magnusonii]MBA4710646.1 2-amino-4-hydroxy-6-hydroxymethyldihydropteridine diphosphokinase [Aquitalea magnusonii]